MTCMSCTLIILSIILIFCETGAHAAKCGLGHYFSFNGCKKCPHGTYKDSRSNAKSCEPCPPNKYTKVQGVTSSNLCLACPYNAIPSTDRRSCTTCRSGYVGNCGKCVRCPPGTYVDSWSCSCGKCWVFSIAPNWNQKECDLCPSGLVPNKESTKCVTPKCATGFGYHEYRGGYTCLPCSGNTYRNESMTDCKSCPFGTVTDNLYGPNTRCYQCQPGYIATDWAPQIQSNNRVPVCLKCPPGSTTHEAGNTICRKTGSKCPVNSAEDANGDCIICDFNHRMDYPTRTCMPCPDGFVAPRGAVKKCTKCPKGAVASPYEGNVCECKPDLLSFNGTCVPCLKGTGGGWIGDSCQFCDEDSIAPRDRMSDCVECPKGTMTVGRNSTKCVPIPKCQPGYIFQTQISGDVSGTERECISMQDGCTTGSKRVIRKGQSICIDNAGNVICPTGSVYNKVNKCISCDDGKYIAAKSLNSSKLICKNCPKNSISIGETATSCTPCPTGFQADPNFGDAYCYCGQGKFIRQCDGACVRCPKGSVNSVENNVSCKRCTNGFKVDYTNQECQCKSPKIIDADGNCVKDNHRLYYGSF